VKMIEKTVVLLTVNEKAEERWRVEAATSMSADLTNKEHTIVLDKNEALDLVRSIVNCFAEKENKDG